MPAFSTRTVTSPSLGGGASLSSIRSSPKPGFVLRKVSILCPPSLSRSRARRCMEQEAAQPAKGETGMADETGRLPSLLMLLDTLGTVARQMHPRRLAQLAALLDAPEAALRAACDAAGATPDPVREQLDLAATHA